MSAFLFPVHNAPFRRPIVFVILASLLLLGVRFAQWTLISLVSQYIEPLIHLTAWCFLVGSILFSIRTLQNVWSTYYALWAISIYATVIFIVWTAPISTISFDLDIALKQYGREQAVAYLTSRHMSEPDVSEKLVALPVRYSFLSSDGEVILTKTGSRLMVCFYMWRGMLSSSSGFVIYTSDNTEPVTPLMHYSRRLQDNWFFGIER